jgi:hypothetical protein
LSFGEIRRHNCCKLSSPQRNASRRDLQWKTNLKGFPVTQQMDEQGSGNQGGELKSAADKGRAFLDK